MFFPFICDIAILIFIGKMATRRRNINILKNNHKETNKLKIDLYIYKSFKTSLISKQVILTIPCCPLGCAFHHRVRGVRPVRARTVRPLGGLSRG